MHPRPRRTFDRRTPPQPVPHVAPAGISPFGTALRRISLTLALVVPAVALGLLAAMNLKLAVGVVGAVVLCVLPFMFPVAHFVILLVVLAIVPFGVQNQFGFGGGTADVGLVASDLLLAAGLARALEALLRQGLTYVQAIAMALTLAFMMVVLLQLAHGIMRGSELNEAGTEARTLIGYGALLVALPILNDERQRRRLLRALVGVGILLGLSGLAQWGLSIDYGESADFGVREGVHLTSSGRGQLLGGLFSFPVPIVLGFAVLLSGEIRARGSQLLLITMIVINAVCLVLTYERTFWVVTVLACALVAVRSGARARWRAALWAPVVGVLVLLPMAALVPNDATTAYERLLSVRQYRDDPSAYYRLVEARNVLEQVRERPLEGSGLGATIYWGRPQYGVPPDRYTYVHNGYLYVAWKLGIVAAFLLVAALVAAALRSRRRIEPPLVAAVVNGAQAALVALLISNVTFPGLASLSATAVTGLLVAICLVAPRVTPRTAPRPRPTPPAAATA